MANLSKDLFVVERDLRLDLLRGLALWMIFLDHIPDDVVSWMKMPAAPTMKCSATPASSSINSA